MKLCKLCNIQTMTFSMYRNVCINCGYTSNQVGSSKDEGFIFNINNINYLVISKYSNSIKIYKEKSYIDPYFIDMIYESKNIINFNQNDYYNFLIKSLKLLNIT